MYDTVAGGLGMFTDPMLAIPGGLSIRTIAKLRKLEKKFNREQIAAQSPDPVERAAAQKSIERIKKQRDKIIKDD
tara:strand:- start:47 stop:271 length:225 start_codon:yes stop_codon:yes gene_type:complete